MFKIAPFLVISFISCCNFTFSQQDSPLHLAQAQLDAYNKGDIDAFMKCFHEDISIWQLGAEAPSIDGFDAVKNAYKELFEASPDLYCEVINRSAVGNKVLDYEKVTGRKGSDKTLFLIMIYEIKDGKIWKCTSVRE